MQIRLVSCQADKAHAVFYSFMVFAIFLYSLQDDNIGVVCLPGTVYSLASSYCNTKMEDSI